MKRNVRRILNGNAPPKTKCAEDISIAFDNVDVMNAYGYNLRHTEMFYVATVIDEDSSFTLFQSRQVINMIEYPREEITYWMEHLRLHPLATINY